MGRPIKAVKSVKPNYKPEKEMCWKDEEVQKTCCIFACSDDDSRRCAGDYSYGYSDNQNTLSGHLTYLKNAVEGVYGTSLHETYVQGNHDRNPQGTGGLTGPGAHDADGYGVYVIDEDDYMWYNNDEARIQQTATNIGVYLAAKVTEKYTNLMFLMPQEKTGLISFSFTDITIPTVGTIISAEAVFILQKATKLLSGKAPNQLCHQNP